jgi:hypothetical protein
MPEIQRTILMPWIVTAFANFTELAIIRLVFAHVEGMDRRHFAGGYL